MHPKGDNNFVIKGPKTHKIQDGGMFTWKFNSILSGVTRTAHRTPAKPQSRPRMATGCYILQADVKRFNQNEFNATCLLCDIGEPENIDHFLCWCSYPPIKDSRERFLPRLIQLLHTALGFERLDEQSEYNEIVQLVLDCTAYDPDESHTHDTAWLALESHAREYCYELHRLRYAAVKELRGSQPCRSRPLLRTA